MKGLIRLTCALLLGAVLATVQGVGAQDSATPEASPAAVPPAQLVPWVVTEPMAPSPEQCTAPPVSTDDLAAQLLALESRSALTITSSGIVAIAATAPAADEAVAGVLETLTQFWACNNAGNRASLVSVMTPQGVADLYELDLTAGETEVRAAVAAALTPGEPRPAEELASIDGVISIVSMDDGRTGALVLNHDPLIAEGAQVIDLIIFVDDAGQMKIDTFVGDPFNMVAGYGYEGNE